MPNFNVNDRNPTQPILSKLHFCHVLIPQFIILIVFNSKSLYFMYAIHVTVKGLALVRYSSRFNPRATVAHYQSVSTSIKPGCKKIPNHHYH